jgi:protein-disulfide isomerase
VRNKNFTGSIVILVSSLAGLFLSVLLILEYFGLAPDAADAVCARGGVNTCTIVSASPFSAIRNVPLIGDVPIAVFGFIFYGFIASVVLINVIRHKDEDIRNLYALILALSLLAFTGDIALYLVSVFIIKFVCPLCAMTYAATAVILLASLILFKSSGKNTAGGSLSMSMITLIKKQIPVFIIITIILTLAGIGIGSGARVIAQAKEASSYEDRLQQAIRQYESVKETVIHLDKAPVFGNRDAKARFVIFYDFTCVHCMKEFDVLGKMMKKNPNAVSVAFRFFSLNGDCGRLEKGRDDSEAEACIASAAALCGYRQGKFLEYSKILFDNYHNKNIKFTEKTVRDAAKKAGMDPVGFDLCFGSKTAREFVQAEYTETERLDINSTPTVFLNGKRLTAGSRKADILQGLVQYCIKRMQIK